MTCSPRSVLSILTLSATLGLLHTSSVLTAATPLGADPGKPILSLAQLGEAAQKQYSGDGIGITPTASGARLQSVFQKLEGQVSAEGLWLQSTEQGVQMDRFRVLATAIGRTEVSADRATLSAAGKVIVTSESVALVRAGLIEEYRVNADGIRQDFVVLERPAAGGELRVSLAVAGAQVEAASYGAKLTLEESGREIAYSRLLVKDAAGRELKARWEVVQPNQLKICVDDSSAVYPVRIDPTFSDADWFSLDAAIGADGGVLTSAVDSLGNLYVGGSFTQIGGVTVNRVAKWDGSAWSALSTGLNSDVRALAVIGTDVYAGGLFSLNGGTSTYIAKWNGASWSGLGTGANSSVEALAVIGTDLYAGGGFSSVNGVSASRVAKWNGSAWSALGTGITDAGFGYVVALAAAGSDLYVGGTFTSAGSVSGTSNIAKWNGSAWSALGTGTDGEVGTIATSGSNVYVGGLFQTAGGVTVRNIAKWSGSAWSSLGEGMNLAGRVRRLLVSGSDLYAGGDFGTAGGLTVSRTARWDGNAWNTMGTGVNNSVYALSDVGGSIFVGGSFTTAGSENVSYIATWNGNVWSAQRSGANNTVYAVAVSGSDLYVGGTFTSVAGVSANRVAHWNGSVWSALGTGTNGDVYALATSGAALYAGGSFTTAGGTAVNNIAVWNGGVWSPLGSGVSGPVSSLTVSASGLYAGGLFETAGGVTVNNIAYWSGSSWSALGTGTNDYVLTILVSGTDVYAGGEFTTAGGLTVNSVAKWNGSSWSSLGTGMNSYVTALALFNSELYAGGNFTLANGASANCIARWNGSAWSALGSGLNSRASSLAVSGPYLYVGGLFTSAGGIGANRIAKWNGSVWKPLGSGADNGVTSLAISGTNLYAGGFFTTAGGKAAGKVAKAFLAPEPEITVFGNSVEIVSGDSTPTPTDFTDFGDAKVVGGSVAHSFSISNGGQGTLNLTGTPKVAISGTHSSDFVVTTQPSSSSVSSLSSLSTTITFDPSAAGLRSAVVTITNDDANEESYTFAIQGTGVVSEISVSGNEVVINSGDTTPSPSDNTDFVSTIVSAGSVTRSYTIANSGTGPLLLTGTPKVLLGGVNAADFTVSSQPMSPVASGASTSFSITFDPTAGGVRMATVSIANDDSDENPYTFAIQGRGYDYNIIEATQKITFTVPSKVYLGQGEVLLQATSSAGLPVSLSLISGPATLSDHTLTLTGTGVIKVRASQAGNAFFKAAKDVDKTITVQTDPTKLTLIKLSQTYTGAPCPVATLGSTDPVVITYGKDNSATVPTDAGKYPVQAVSGSAVSKGTLIITKAPLVVSADFQRKLVGQDNPSLTLSYSGFLNGDTVGSALTTEPFAKTTAKTTSAAGSYPISPSGGVSTNYSFIYVKGTLWVEGYAGLYETLLNDLTTLDPIAKLEITIASSNAAFTGKLTTLLESKVVAIKGTLTPNFAAETTSGIGSGKVGTTNYNVTFTLPLGGDFTAEVSQNAVPICSASDGKKLLVLVKPATLSFVGAHTLNLAPVTGAGVLPGGSGYAIGKINDKGNLAIAGKLADGTTLTASLAVDGQASYRLFTLPYKGRLNSYLGGKISLEEHPDIAGRGYVSAASNTQLLWAKAAGERDASYRAGFGNTAGPLETLLTLDPWLPPVAAKGATPAVSLTQRLGLSGSEMNVLYDSIVSESFASLPTSVSINSKNAVSVLAPITSPLNATGWKVKLTPATGLFTGSFVLKDTVESKIISRTVKFNGVLRQASSSDVSHIVGAGQFLLPALPGEASNEISTGEILFMTP